MIESVAEADDLAHDPDKMPPFDSRGVEVAATAGGVTNGFIGAWGPVVTPFLLHRGLSPRFAIGSVNTAEVAVAVVSAGSLIFSLGGESIEIGVLLAMLVGGVLASPIAAWMVRHVKPRPVGVAVGALLLLTNAAGARRVGRSGRGALACLRRDPVLVAAAWWAPGLAARRGREQP